MLKISNRIIVILVILLTISVFAWAIKNEYRKVPAPSPVHKRVAIADIKSPVYEKALLTRLETVFQKHNAEDESYTISGDITVNDMTDSTKRLNKVPFVMSRNGGDFYYMLGQTQTLNAEGLYLYIDNSPKTILMSMQKEITGNDGFKQAITGISKGLLSEHYELSSTRKGREQTISMVNEHHITCKQYDVTIDTTNMQLRKIFIRYTNFNDPSKTDNEKVITVKVNEWTDTGQPEKYLKAANVVRKQGDGYKVTAGYANYELIKM